MSLPPLAEFVAEAEALLSALLGGIESGDGKLHKGGTCADASGDRLFQDRQHGPCLLVDRVAVYDQEWRRDDCEVSGPQGLDWGKAFTDEMDNLCEAIIGGPGAGRSSASTCSTGSTRGW